jgi:hypothetical protein
MATLPNVKRAWPGTLVGPALSGYYVPDTNPTQVLGTTVWAQDPALGVRELIYLQNGATVLQTGTICIENLDHTVSPCPLTTRQGFPVCLSITRMAASTYGWFALQGFTPVWSDAEVAIGAAGGI